MIEIPQLRGLTQSRTLRQVVAMTREFIAADQNRAPDSFEIDLSVESVGALSDVSDRVAAIGRTRERARELTDQATAELRTLAQDLSAQGASLRDIGQIVGLSHQRVEQLVNA